MSLSGTTKGMTMIFLTDIGIWRYSHLANRRGTFINFSKFFRPPRSLLGPPRLLIFKKKISVQDVFTPDLLYFQFFPSENAYLTHI